MSTWYSSVYKAFMMVCIICFLISFSTSGETKFNSTLAGYILLILSILLILIILTKNILQVTNGKSMFQSILTMIMTLGPFMLTLGTMGFLLYLFIYYKTHIIENHVLPTFYNFSQIISFLLLAQLYIIYTNIKSDSFEATKKISKSMYSLLYLFGTLILILTLIMYSILKYFRTDG